MSVIVPSENSLANRDNPAVVYISSLPSSKSRRVMISTLKGIIRLITDADVEIPDDAWKWFAWERLRYQEVQAIRARLIESVPPNTANRHLSALRGVLKECWNLGLMTAEEYQRAVNIKNVAGESKPAGRDIPDHEMRKILLSCYDDGKRGIRNLAALAILATCSLRRAELENLDLSDFDPTTGDLQVKGKGRKHRTVTIVNKARQALDAWLEIRGDAPGALFYAFRKGDRIKPDSRWKADDLYEFITTLGATLGLKRLTPHDFRRTFIGNALDVGIDPVLLTSITGHASVDMLKKYDRRPQRTRREAQKKIDLPI